MVSAQVYRPLEEAKHPNAWLDTRLLTKEHLGPSRLLGYLSEMKLCTASHLVTVARSCPVYSAMPQLPYLLAVPVEEK